jgi:uncharacterized protein involved in type VI secretion and phage assembly
LRLALGWESCRGTCRFARNNGCCFQLDLVCKEADLDLKALPFQTATLTVTCADGARKFHIIISEVAQGAEVALGRFAHRLLNFTSDRGPTPVAVRTAE